MHKRSFKEFLLETSQSITEAPLPDEWDRSIFNDKIPFKTRVEYAKKNAEKLGAGSSRIAFVIPYEGRDTVLKIAKNRKGMAQNGHEVSILTDGYARTLDLFIPIIDYDTESNEPTWIHTERAFKVSKGKFKEFTGGTPNDLVTYARSLREPNNPNYKYYTINPDSEIVANFVDFALSFSENISDYTNLSNWGIYNGKLVIIDAGLSNEILRTMYR